MWNNIPRAHAKKMGWKIIKTRRIDINKGDDEQPVYRSRIVAKEFNNEMMDGLFAGTPPLEAPRFLVHEAATVEGGEMPGDKVMMINDVARAFFEAGATRQICVELPEEDVSDRDIALDRVGHLMRSLHGARNEAMRRQTGEWPST